MARPLSFSPSLTNSPPTPQLSTTTAVSTTPRLGGSSSLPSASLALAAQERSLSSDPKWRKFSSLIEKTLQSFEQVAEWADFITFLAKLLKSLQSYPHFQLIPHKLTVAKRLSQCLNPALPTGVHQRALDVYTHILTAIGADNLRRDLPAWSSGLFPFFQYAATSVKPIVLGIYERFYLPLQEALRPATKAFILALLPGLEEETGEFFEKVAALLDRVSGTVSPSFFFQNMWLVLITAPNSRIPALNYLARRLPKFSENADSVAHIAGEDIGLMLRGFAAALEDSQILVQRAILDLLTSILPISSKAFASTRRTDQVLLMRAVTGVVLRRDLSLSRRLYSWLLGQSEHSEEQIAHLKRFGLALLRDSLRQEMAEQGTHSHSSDRQRPFKIFISLLDKWEIGNSLTEVLVLDAFRALRSSLRPGDDHDELLMTANMLFEILDPFLMWKQIYFSIRTAVEGASGWEEEMDEEGAQHDAVDLVRFIIRTFRLHDEEVQKLHAPLTAFGILDLVALSTLNPTTTIPAAAAHARELANTLDLTLELLKEISPAFYETVDRHEEVPPEHLGRQLADTLYGAEDMKAASLPEMEGRELLTAAFTTALTLAHSCAAKVAAGESGELLLRASLDILANLAEATKHSAEQLPLRWDPEQWTDALLAAMAAAPACVANFPIHAAIVRGVLTLYKTPALYPPIAKNRRYLVDSITSKLLAYLEPHNAPCFVEAVQLLWGAQALSDQRHAESMIAERLASTDKDERVRAFEAFGNLWRFTEDAQLPGTVLRVPMFKMLDALKSEDLSTRRAGEAWMRCSLKSYLRILDPLFFTLLDPSIVIKQSMIKVRGLRVPILTYTRTFDQARVHHVLDDLLALARFGGQGFIRIAKGSFLKHSLDPAFRERVINSQLDNQTYLDGLVALLVRFLRAEPDDNLAPSLAPLNAHIHSVVAELLQILITRGDGEFANLSTVESALMSRLFLSIDRGEVDLQNKLLHVLHSVITVAHAHARRLNAARKDLPQLPTSPSQGTLNGESKSARDKAHANEAHPPDLSQDGMFVRIVTEAITTQSNGALVHHWVDFLLMTIPQFRAAIHSVLFPLIDCLVQRLEAFVDELDATYLAPGRDAAGAVQGSEATDAEYTVLTNALERVLTMALNEANALVQGGNDAESVSGKTAISSSAADGPSSSGGGPGGLLGYMTGVLGNAEVEQGDISEETKTKHAALARLRDTVNLLLRSWQTTAQIEKLALVGSGPGAVAVVEDELSTTRGYVASRARMRARKALEKVHAKAPEDALDDVMAYWAANESEGLEGGESEAHEIVFAAVELLVPSAQAVVSYITAQLKAAATAAGSGSQADRTRSPYRASDELLFAFLEAYLARLDNPSGIQVWATVLGFTRELLGNLSTARGSVFPALRCFTVLAEKVSQTSALEDRRMRRDCQETFIRLVDASIQLAGRTVEQGGWLRRHHRVGAPDANGDADSVRSLDKAKGAQQADSASLETAEDEKRAGSGSAVQQQANQAQEMTLFLAERVLADLRRFHIEPDKLSQVCSNMVYYLVAPAFKTRSRTLDIPPSVFALLKEMVGNSATTKAWKSAVADVFADNRFFNQRPQANKHWIPLVRALMAADKEAVRELVGRISTVSSANIFTNRELEALSRALSLRRLTYVLLAGEKDRYLKELPAIQEKLVDLLRSPVGDSVHAEVYLCLRVLFVRVTTHHLAGLWPVILTELLRLFESLLDPHAPGTGSLENASAELLQLVLSASKFLDLTLVLQTEEFQIHEWMFVTDTVDAIYPPDSWAPQAVMDRIGDVLANSAVARAHLNQATLLSSPPHDPPQSAKGSPVLWGESGSPNPAEPLALKRVGPRRPMLRSRRVHSIADLAPFFQSVSLRAYEGVYDGGGRVDWDEVEGALERDLFELSA